MQQTYSLADTTLRYVLKRSRQARHARIVVRATGIEVVAPHNMPTRRVQAFIQAKKQWIERHSAAFQRQHSEAAAWLPIHYRDGAQLLYRGTTTLLRVMRMQGTRVCVTHVPGCLSVSLPAVAITPEAEERRVRQALERWFRDELKTRAEQLAPRYTALLGAAPHQIRIKTQRRLWGSCGSTGIVNLNWRLSGAPDSVFEYVLVHELCHLRRRDHSPAFWQLVENLMPSYRVQRRWLRDNDLLLSGLLA